MNLTNIYEEASEKLKLLLIRNKDKLLDTLDSEYLFSYLSFVSLSTMYNVNFMKIDHENLVVAVILCALVTQKQKY